MPHAGRLLDDYRIAGITVDGEPWTRVEDLSRRGPDDSVYTVTHDDSGVTWVRFGDGTHGRCPPSGSTVVAAYEGGSGNVRIAATTAPASPARDQALWVAIRNSSDALSFGHHSGCGPLLEGESAPGDQRAPILRLRRAAAAFVLLFVLAVAWNGLLHLVVLRRADEAVRGMRRTDLSHPAVLAMAVTAAVCLLFVWGYSRIARTGSRLEGAGYGLFVGLFAAVLVDLNQYLLYPLPFRLVAIWFVGGVLEFTLYGAVLSRFFPLRSPAAGA